MAIYELSHLNDLKYIRPERQYFFMGDVRSENYDYELQYHDNIHEKNKSYCELTGIYAIYKNKKDAYIAIEHYRRAWLDEYGKLLSEKQIAKLLKKYDVVIPFSGHISSSVFDQYIQSHDINDYYVLREVIREFFPKDFECFRKVWGQNKLTFYNMFIMRKDLFDSYCSWLFEVLNHVEQRIDLTGRGVYQTRVFGFMAERLLLVWLNKNVSKKKICERQVAFISSDGTYRRNSIKTLLRTMKHNLFK